MGGWLNRASNCPSTGQTHCSGKVRVYLEHYSDDARRVLVDRYGQDIVVDTQSRQWRFT